MAGTFNSKWVHEGTLPNADGDLYVVPAVTTDLIKTIILCNTGATAEDIILRKKKAGGNSRRITNNPFSLAGNESIVVFIGNGIVLEAGDSLRGQSTTAATVEISVDAIRET